MTAAVVLAGAPLTGLDELLGTERRTQLEDALLRHATAWAEDVAPGHVTVERGAPTDLGPRIAAAFERDAGPVLVVNPGTPRLGPHHAAAALGDVEAGAAASFGPNMDGGWYLAVLGRPVPELFDLAAEVWDGPVVMARMLQVAGQLGLEVGLLRMERRLASAADVRAFLDPLTPQTVIDALS